MVALGVTTAIGALAGAGLLLVSSEDLFEAIVPFLILGACGCWPRSPPCPGACAPQKAKLATTGRRGCTWARS